MDIVLRDCGDVGWLGILKGSSGKELYRTGKHHDRPEEALNAVQQWINK